MKKCLKNIARRNDFTRKLLSARHVDIVMTLDIILSMFYSKQAQVSHVVREFVANKITIEGAVRRGYGYMCPIELANYYYNGEYLTDINLVLGRMNGVCARSDMHYCDVMKLKAKLDHRVIRHALDFGAATKENRCQIFTENYKEL